MVLAGPYQLRIFHDSIPSQFFKLLSFGEGAIEGKQGTCASFKYTFLVRYFWEPWGAAARLLSIRESSEEFSQNL